jgi:glycosyltransferase involved in cell wall biosynthesis
LKKALLIGMVWPEPNSSAAGTRILQLINLLKEGGYDIVFASAAQEGEFSFDFSATAVVKQNIKLNCPSFDVFVNELRPELVLFDRYITEEQFGWRVVEHCPNAIRLLDTEDLHCLRLARQKAVKKDSAFELTDLLLEPVAKREIASILRCDLSLIISEFEMGILQDIFKMDLGILHYLPLFYKAKDSFQLKSREERKDFIFIGNFLHEPNWDAVKQLKELVWPSIRKVLPHVSLNIYGAYPSQKVVQLNNPKDGFVIHGRAANALEVIGSAKVLLAPIRFGAGLKGKLLEAMQVGTPCVTSGIGAEGIAGKYDWDGCIASDISDFVKKAIALHDQSDIWNQSQQDGFQILANRFDQKNFAFDFFSRLENLIFNLTAHRKQNFIGSLLLHHNALSIKYMAKWIEEKNKVASLLGK